MSTKSGVFVLQSDQSLVAMQPTQFAAEVDFQQLLTKFPALLVGDQIDPESPRRFMLVKQEQPVGHDGDPSRWSIDHLFLDQDGIPTLVEVKRQSDTRLRREVVGQMLDYAANCQAFWSYEQIQTSFEATCIATGAQSDAVLEELLAGETTPEAFWTQVETNLLAGRLRMLFVADQIPSELRRIVEFLNEQMNPAEILAIELRQFTGQGLRTLVPMVFGLTQEAVKKKEPSAGVRWTEERILEAIDTKFSIEVASLARSIVSWLKSTGVQPVYGTGRDNGSVYPLLRPKGTPINPAYLSTDGKLWLQFKSLNGKPIFGDLDKRRELLAKFAAISGLNLSDADLEAYRAIPLATIAADPQGQEKVIAALNWIVDQVKAAS